MPKLSAKEKQPTMQESDLTAQENTAGGKRKQGPQKGRIELRLYPMKLKGPTMMISSQLDDAVDAEEDGNESQAPLQENPVPMNF